MYLLMRLGKRFGCFTETTALKQDDRLRRATTHLFFMHYFYRQYLQYTLPIAGVFSATGAADT